MSSVVYLFLAHLGIGIAFTLLFVSKEAGVKFFRFNAGTAALLLAAALAFRPRESPLVNPATLASLGVALVSLTIYWVIAGRVLGYLRPWLAGLAATIRFDFPLREAELIRIKTRMPTPGIGDELLIGDCCTD